MEGMMRDGEMIALGWTLLHFCWQGAAIAVLYAAADRMVMRSGMRVRYAVAMLALLLMPVVAVTTYEEQLRLVVHVPVGTHDVVVSQLGVIHAGLVKGLPMAAPAVESGEVWIASNARRLMPWMDGVWLAGVVMLALRAMGGWIALQRLKRRARLEVPAEVAASFRRVKARLRMGRRVVLRVSDEVISPMAMGIWHAAIVLPVSALMQLDPEQLEAVLAHELAHVRRWDYLYNLLQTTVECLLFFHPAVWWVSRCTRDLREGCCDEVAARSCADPVVYAEALLQLEEQRTSELRARQLQLGMALKGRDGSLLIRVKQILGEGMAMEKTMDGTMTSGVRVVVAAAILLGVMMGSRVAKGLSLPHPVKQEISAVLHKAAVGKIATKQTPVVAATVAPVVAANVTPVVTATVTTAVTTGRMEGVGDEANGQSGTDYIKEMNAAGYALDLNKDLDELIAMKSVGVTPEYAREMQGLGLGKPMARELVSMKSVGVTPEYAKEMASLGKLSIEDLISARSVGVTPEYQKEMAGIGKGPLSLRDLISARSVGVTPKYAKEMEALGPASMQDLIGARSVGVTPGYAKEMEGIGKTKLTLRDLISAQSVGVTPGYAKDMAGVGMAGLDVHELVSLRSQGVTPEYVKWVKATFPGADAHVVSEGAAIGVNAEFVAKAKAHGFAEAGFDKLVRLKESGLLD